MTTPALADADPDLVEFTDVNATYATAFAPFSPERLFAPIGSNVTRTQLRRPEHGHRRGHATGSGSCSATSTAPRSRRSSCVAPDGQSLGTYNVPATAGDASLSFLGVRYDAGERIAVARITTGEAALGADDVTQGGAADVVAMDDIIYGEPQATPPPAPEQPDPVEPPDTKAPRVDVDGAKGKVQLRRLLRGLDLTVSADEPASYEVSLLASAKSVEIARKNEVVLAAKSDRPHGRPGRADPEAEAQAAQAGAQPVQGPATGRGDGRGRQHDDGQPVHQGRPLTRPPVSHRAPAGRRARWGRLISVSASATRSRPR